MKTFIVTRFQFNPLRCPNLTKLQNTIHMKHQRHTCKPYATNSTRARGSPLSLEIIPKSQEKLPLVKISQEGYSRKIIIGAVSLGFMVFLMGMDDQNKALAFGPEGPLVEEFWDNVRRYALYALTVSTGALYTILQPILELLKNPISAILVLVILGGGIYIVSQVLTAMVGVSEFAYDYAY